MARTSMEVACLTACVFAFLMCVYLGSVCPQGNPGALVLAVVTRPMSNLTATETTREIIESAEYNDAYVRLRPLDEVSIHTPCVRLASSHASVSVRGFA